MSAVAYTKTGVLHMHTGNRFLCHLGLLTSDVPVTVKFTEHIANEYCD
jgi:hypothetical protein